jgi:DNA repair exonuclease SbcCD ATPase subunit
MIKQLHLKGFGIHKDLTVNFQGGLNAIIGQNRKGKTNIMESICFAYYGKTQNSTLDKIINFEMERATVKVSSDTCQFSRTRSPNSSKLEGIDKLALDKELNLGYQEFLSIFYISSHEQKSLFDPSYFRNFLISLFGLEVYAKKYERLSSEYQGLQAAVQSYKKVNVPLLKARYVRVQAAIQRLSEERVKYGDAHVKCQTVFNQLATKEGEIRVSWNTAIRKENLIAQAKCTECGRPFSPEDIQARLAKINEAKQKITTVHQAVEAKKASTNAVYVKVEEKLNAIDYRIEKGRNLLYRIQEKAKQQGPQINITRIKELESLMPIFKASGFPSYLLQVYVPVIVESANNLLQMMFPDMRVSIRTEKPESGRPDFKVLVHKKDVVQEISDLCGAERVLVNLCFRLGIMVIFKQLSKTNIDFFMVDEGFEKLDSENAIEALRLFDNFIGLGYLKQVILVTHKKELKSLKNVNYIEL